MGRLAAWVATFPDDVRAEYDKAMPSGRSEILRKQLAEWKKRESRIVAEVAKAEREASVLTDRRESLGKDGNFSFSGTTVRSS